MVTQFRNLTDLLTFFKDEQTCIDYFVQKRWNGIPKCPYCNHDKVYRISQGKRFKCANSECYKIFSVKVGSIFEDSNLPLRTWFMAIYILTSHKKGISSVQLAKDLGISQKSSWHVEHRIREMLRTDETAMLHKEVEIDETYIGGKEKNRHNSKKAIKYKVEGDEVKKSGKYITGRSLTDKVVVLGILERNGKVVAKRIPDAKTKTILPIIEKNVSKGSTVLTDEYVAYVNLGNLGYNHKAIYHKQNIYVDGYFHTNSIENFWSILKRGLYGIYHYASKKHLDRYLDEFCARYNTRKLGEVERFNYFLEQSSGKILTWKKLTQATI